MFLKISAVVLFLSALLFWWHLPVTLTPGDYQTHVQDKVVLLCGSSSGIGKQLAYQLAQQGAQLVLVARTEDKLLKVKERAMELGSPRVEVLPFDLSDVSNGKKVVDKTVEMFGRLDYMVLNHASMAMGMFLAFEKQQNPEFIERMFRINVFSFIELTVHALPHLEASKGHIFITSSTAGEVPTMFSGLYDSTKHSINGFFYSLQQELLAKDSSVSLTVGALGLILTDDITILMGDRLKEQPSWTVGDVKECVTGMMNSLILRPRTFTYPKLAGYLGRFMWYFNPYFHEMSLHGFEKRGGYNGSVKLFQDSMEKAKEIGFQKGNLGI